MSRTWTKTVVIALLLFVCIWGSLSLAEDKLVLPRSIGEAAQLTLVAGIPMVSLAYLLARIGQKH